MPCSCKAKRTNTAEIRKQHKTVKVDIQIPRSPQQMVSSIHSIIQSVSDSSSLAADYDYSSTTQPVQLCYNCIRKHLSIAYTLLQESDSGDFLTALGQVLCASLHLTTADRDLHNEMQNSVVRTIRGEDKQPLMQDILQWIEKAQESHITTTPMEVSPLQANLLGLLKAYGLLFVQVSYQEINKSWATAELFKGAIKKFQFDKNIQEYQNVRQIWKLIQSMQLYDKTYEDAQKALREEILKQWRHYKEHKG